MSLESFSQKIIKKIETLAFTNSKIKTINVSIADKVQLYIDKAFKKEIQYFQKKYSYKINFLSEKDLIIPEYKILLLNKNKKVLNKVENISKIKTPELINKNKLLNKNDSKSEKVVKISNKKNEKSKKNNFKGKKNTVRTLWVRKKKVS